MTTAEFIAREEGLRLEPYHDVAGYPTIGVGHKLSDDRWADLSQWPAITKTEALVQLEKHLEWFTYGVMTAIQPILWSGKLTALTALTSLAFNIGCAGLARSELAKLINRRAPDWEIVLEWLDWCKATIDGRKRVVEGLLNRRRREVALYFGG